MSPADCTADLTILCAGTCEYLDQGVVDAALVERVMSTNFQGPVNCLAALQTQLLPGSRVALVSSMAHWLPFPRAEAYGASKAALTWFANSLRLDWEPKGIAVTVVSPGFVDTPLPIMAIFMSEPSCVTVCAEGNWGALKAASWPG